MKKEFLVDLACSAFQVGEKDLEKVCETLDKCDDYFYDRFMNDVIPEALQEGFYPIDLVELVYTALKKEAIDELDDLIKESLDLAEENGKITEEEKERLIEELYEAQEDCVVFSCTEYNCENLRRFLDKEKVKTAIKESGIKISKTLGQFLELIGADRF